MTAGSISNDFSETNIAGPPTQMTANSGTTPQTTAVNTPFTNALAVTVLDAANNPVSGLTVTFTAPVSGASGKFTGNVTTIGVITNASGVASAPFTANGTGGNYTVTATAAGPPSVNFSLTNTGGTATHFSVTAPGTATAGTAFNFTVTALDVNNSVSTGYTGTVHFTSSDGAGTIPVNYTFVAGDSGAHVFSATLKTSGNQTLTATDTATGSITGTSGNSAVSAGAATHFTVSAPGTATAGAAFNFPVTARDTYNNTATSYTGTAHLTSSDPASVLPGNYSFVAGDNGAHVFSGTLKTSGNQTLTATDISNGSRTGSSGNILVSAGAATHFTVSAPGTATAGTAFNFTVTALDIFNNTATGYTGTAHFTSSDSQATLPVNYAFVAADNGAHVFSGTLRTIGNQTLTATDTATGSITGTSGNIAVSGGTGTHFTVSAPGTATAGTAFSFTVTALDAFNNTATGYRGTAHITSSDSAAILPADYTFVAGDNGAHAFSGTILKTAGIQTLTATDTATGSITGTSGNITVSPGATSHFTVSAPGTATGGTAFNITVTAKDAFNNTTPSYSGIVHFTSTDGAATLPANTTLVSGTGTLAVTLNTSGSQTVTATDTVTSSITGTSGTITVSSPTALLTSVTPNSGAQGATITSVALVGSFTHFAQGTSVATFGAGITVNSLTVTDATHASANITIASGATTGARNVTVTTGGEVVTLTNGFTVGAGSPVLTSVTPKSGEQGATITSVALVGTFTHFVQGTSVATFGAGITVNSLTVTDASHASANITISPTAPTGASNVTVTTGGEVVTLTNGFTVGAGTPVLTSVNPNSGAQGATITSVALVGTFTHFVQGTSVATFGAGITVNSLTVTDATHASANITISPTAPTGASNVTVTTGGEVVTLTNGFTVTAGTPVLTSVNPNSGAQGATITSVALIGTFTHFVQGTSVATFGAGITVNSLTVTEAAQASANITIASGATTGARNVTVTTGGEVVTLTNGFTVGTGTPVLTSVTPNSGLQGATITSVALVGTFTHFVQGTSVATFGTGITVNSLTVTDASHASANITISPTAPPGASNVTVTTGGEVVTLTNGFTVTSGTPVLISVTPNSGLQGATIASVALVGFVHALRARYLCRDVWHRYHG